jgi:hypothetical protein
VNMHPTGSFASSHVFPLAVGSPIFPGAKVPDFIASSGSPPMAAIWTAKVNAICLLMAVALGEAGSWCCDSAPISGFSAVCVQRAEARPTCPVLRSRAPVRQLQSLAERFIR